MEKIFIIENFLKDELEYEKLKKEIKNKISNNYSNRLNTVIVSINQSKYKFTLINLLTNLILWYPFVKFQKELNKDFLFEASDINEDLLNFYFNKLIEEFKDNDSYEELSFSISKIHKELSELSAEANSKIGNTISLFNIVELSKNNKFLYNLLTLKIPQNKQFSEIEDFLSTNLKDLTKILSESDSVFSDYLNSKTGINVKQLGQTIMNIGLKPDIDGNIINEPIDASYLVGLRNVRDFYINAKGARKALITNFHKVKESGYLTRKLSLLMTDTFLKYDFEDCKSNNLIKCELKDEKTLKRLEGKWYKKDNNELKVLNLKDKDLIGETIYIRSPITCNTKNNKICRKCYGDNLAKLNKNYHTGILAVLTLTNQLTQMLLSSKHLMQTKSNKIEFQPEFTEYFTIDRNMIFLSKIDPSSIVIDMEDIVEDEENNLLILRNFKIKNKKFLNIESNIDLILTDELINLINEYKLQNGLCIIPLKAINPDSVVFNIVMENNELSASLNAILELIETNNHLGLTDIHDIYNKFIDLLNESGIKINSTHIELILRSLIRNVEDLKTPPDFSLNTFPNYKILRVSEAIIKSTSVSVSLAFEQIRKQLESPETYSKKEYSLVDELL